MFFTYFYTAIAFNPKDVSENMQKQGGFIPGIRPGKHTADFIDNILTKITLPGSIFLAIIAILPAFVFAVWRDAQFRAVLRRHEPSDHGRRCPGYVAAGRVASVDAAL